MLYSKFATYYLVKKPKFMHSICMRFIEYIDNVEKKKVFPEFPRPTTDAFRERILNIIDENIFFIDNVISYKIEEAKEKQGYAYDEKTTVIDLNTSELTHVTNVFSRCMLIAKEFLDFVRVENKYNYHYVNLANLLHSYCNANINRINKYFRSAA